MDDTLDILKQYIRTGRDNYIKAIRIIPKDDIARNIFQGRINECNEILKFITEIESPDFSVNSIANIDK